MPSLRAPGGRALAQWSSTSRCCWRPAAISALTASSSCPRRAQVQMHRIRARRRMSDTDIEAVIARQMPDAEKRRRADVVIRTGLSRHASQKALSRLIREVLAMSRAILFDTETTGLEPQLGHRVIEVAALELLNDLPTGRHFHALIHPDRDIPEDATRDPRLHPGRPRRQTAFRRDRRRTAGIFRRRQV